MSEATKSPEQGTIFSSQGNPFKTEAAARTAISHKGLDKNIHEVKSHEDGFVIVRKQEQVAEEKYYHVVFNHKQNPNDEDDVTLIVNGKPLVFKRGVPTIISEGYKECADHATYPHFTQKPNEVRKMVGTIMIFPYSCSGEATKAEYDKALAAGNKATLEAIAANDKLVQ